MALNDFIGDFWLFMTYFVYPTHIVTACIFVYFLFCLLISKAPKKLGFYLWLIFSVSPIFFIGVFVCLEYLESQKPILWAYITNGYSLQIIACLLSGLLWVASYFQQKKKMSAAALDNARIPPVIISRSTVRENNASTQNNSGAGK